MATSRPHEITYWREALWLCSLWEGICWPIEPQGSHANPFLLQELQVSEMPQVLCPQILPEQTLRVFLFQGWWLLWSSSLSLFFPWNRCREHTRDQEEENSCLKTTTKEHHLPFSAWSFNSNLSIQWWSPFFTRILFSTSTTCTQTTTDTPATFVSTSCSSRCLNYFSLEMTMMSLITIIINTAMMIITWFPCKLALSFRTETVKEETLYKLTQD